MKSERVVDTERTDRTPPASKQPYTQPAVIHELRLETRAGTPLGVPNPLDPTGLDPAE